MSLHPLHDIRNSYSSMDKKRIPEDHLDDQDESKSSLQNSSVPNPQSNDVQITLEDDGGDDKKSKPSPNKADQGKVQKITDCLQLLGAKVRELQNRKCRDAANAAKEIYKGINELFIQYKARTISEQEFKKGSKKILTPEYRKELEQFRGWKLKKVGEVLVNLLIFITSLGTSYLFSLGKLTIFKVKTDSSEKVDDLKREINQGINNKNSI